MKPYEVFLRVEVMEVLRGIRPKQRANIGSFIDSLALHPFQRGDYSEEDKSQRQIEIKVIGQYAMTYWADHAVKEVKIVDIRRADGP